MYLAKRFSSTFGHHPGRLKNKGTDQNRTIEPSGACLCSACLGSAFPMSGLRTLSSPIVRVRSTACNHGQVSRRCMIMQSTTCQSTLEMIRCRQSTVCVSIDPLQVGKENPSSGRALDKWNATDDRAVASKLTIRKWPIHRFGPSDCSSLCVGSKPQIAESTQVNQRASVEARRWTDSME
jgi:hypothetical protein